MRQRRGFSLVELVIVVVVLGVIAAVAVPRLSRGSRCAADAALAKDVQSLRKAIDLYAAEHGGQLPSASGFREQMRRYTDAGGNVSTKRTARFCFGPYLADVPDVPAGPAKGKSGVSAVAGSGVGWIYFTTTGDIRVNAAEETDSAGRRYADY